MTLPVEHQPDGSGPGDERPYATVNPATGEQLQDFPYHRGDELEAMVDTAGRAFRSWRQRPAAGRAEVVGRAADLMLERRDELARLQTLEMGKPISDSRGEVEWVAGILRYYAEHGPGFLEPEALPAAYGASTVVSEPLGVLLAIEPWNFPLYQALRVAGPQLVAGNVVLMKHSEICPQSALAVEKLFRDAGAPDGVYTNVFLAVADVEHVIAHDAVQGVTFTGSDRSGAAVALANSSPYGLGGHVYGSDGERARSVADRLETGMIAVNRGMGSNGDLPFGGVKRSGYGRELSHLGMLEFVNRRLVLV
jgi:succinate-semialdehyde dehydrogenase/glutarate-semialdehyde dehydrogenase